MSNEKPNAMKKSLLLMGLFLFPFLALAQVSKQQAMEYALSLLANTKDAYDTEAKLETAREILPVTNLEVATYDNDTVFLTWSLPKGFDSLPMVLSWTRSDTVEDQIQYGMDSYMAQLYDTHDLANFQGWKMDAVTIQKVCNWKHVLYVWKQEHNQEMEELYVQAIPEEVPLGEYSIKLDEDLYIEPNTRYFFGIRAFWESGKDRAYPFAVDNGPAAVGKGLFLKDNSGTEWLDASNLLFCNFWLQVLIRDPNRVVYETKDNNLNLTGYRIYCNGELINEIPYSFVTYFKDTEFTKGVDVEYCVTAVYGNEESEPVCATATITGVYETTTEDNIVLTPNPTTGIVHIKGTAVAEVLVYNALGQLVKTVRNAIEIDLGHLPAGVYFATITDKAGKKCVRKVVKE